MTDHTWMIYGAYGYSGSLIAREAVSRGLTPMIAGRDQEKTRDLASELGLQHRVASYERIGEILDGVETLLNCAGPFEITWKTIVEQCIERKINYLDITGEIKVFEGIMRKDDEARQVGISLIPGVGFDVVPTDCLAAHLAELLPDATHLDLAFYQRGGGLSRGTLKTVIRGLGEKGAIRNDGRIVSVPVAFDNRDIPFSAGVRSAMTIPWGDVSTAFHTTSIPNIRVYQGTPPERIRKLRRYRALLPLAAFPPVRFVLNRLADRHQGPDEDARDHASMFLWGEVRKGQETVSMTMETPEGYELTADSAVSAVQRILSGSISTGALTPAKAFGKDFVCTLEGVTLHKPVHSTISN